METKFTKGEWEPVIYSGEHKVEVWAGDDQIYANGSVTNKEEEFANAYLIASAPEMYKEIQDMSSWLRTQIGMGDWHKDLEKLLKKARGEL